jgi:hypothetical protein
VWSRALLRHSGWTCGVEPTLSMFCGHCFHLLLQDGRIAPTHMPRATPPHFVAREPCGPHSQRTPRDALIRPWTAAELRTMLLTLVQSRHCMVVWSSSFTEWGACAECLFPCKNLTHSLTIASKSWQKCLSDCSHAYTHVNSSCVQAACDINSSTSTGVIGQIAKLVSKLVGEFAISCSAVFSSEYGKGFGESTACTPSCVPHATSIISLNESLTIYPPLHPPTTLLTATNVFMLERFS